MKSTGSWDAQRLGLREEVSTNMMMALEGAHDDGTGGANASVGERGKN
jgi:hypothetical protein